MKHKGDPRHQHRIQRMKLIFANTFGNISKPQKPELTSILKNLPQIDKQIMDAAPEWPLEQINRVDLAILRLSIQELQEGHTPYKVVIDEAVELAKEYGSEKSAQFVNGVLGTVVEKSL